VAAEDGIGGGGGMEFAGVAPPPCVAPGEFGTLGTGGVSSPELLAGAVPVAGVPAFAGLFGTLSVVGV
jgi:hypothetical protein